MEYQALEGKGSILTAEGETGEESYMMEMLKKNRLPGLLPVQISSIDGCREYYYDAGKNRTLAEYLEGKTVDAQMLQSYLTGMKELLDCMEEYLLEPDSLCMQAEHIYVDEKEHRLKFCYAPCAQGPFEKGLIKLWQLFLQRLDYSDRQSVIMAYEVYQGIVREGYLSAFTYKKEAQAEMPEIVFPWEKEDDVSDLSVEAAEREQEEKAVQLQLPAKWKWYAAGILLCGAAAGICYWSSSLAVTGAVMLATAGILYALIHFGRQDKGIDSVRNTW